MGIASVLNFVGAFISLAVAATVANGIVQADLITTTIVFAGLVGAIAWNLATWYFGLPSSSSHALIGGVVGAAFAAEGSQAIQGDGLVEKVLIPAVIAPILAFVVAAIAIVIAYRIVGRLRPGPVNRGYRLGQLVSGGHARALARHERCAEDDGHHHPRPRRPRQHLRVAFLHPRLGRRLLGERDRPRHLRRAAGGSSAPWASASSRWTRPRGSSAQGAGAAIILAASHFGYPLSTTQTITGGIMGAGAGKRLSAVRWGVAGNIVGAWVLTLPASALVGAATYGVTRDLRHRARSARSSWRSRCSRSSPRRSPAGSRRAGR